jgi:hypothetical protein
MCLKSVAQECSVAYDSRNLQGATLSVVLKMPGKPADALFAGMVACRHDGKSFERQGRWEGGRATGWNNWANRGQIRKLSK